MNNPANIDDMTRLLDRQVEALTVVLDVLEQERTALAERDVDAVARLSERKHGSLAAVDELETRRREIAPSLAAMEMLTEVPNVARRWEKLLDLTRRCRELNDGNGRLIRRQQRRVESTLQLLRGGESPREATYGPDGENRRAGGPNRPPIASI